MNKAAIALIMMLALTVGAVAVMDESADADTTYTISVTAGTGGSAIGYYYVELNGSLIPAYFNSPGTVSAGSTVGLTATADSEYTFTNWTDSSGTVVSTANPYEFTVTASETYTANFSISTYSVSVTAATGGSATGYRTVGGMTGYFNTATVSSGTTVGLSATADTDYTFAYWSDSSGTVVSTANPYEFTVTASETYTAHFTSGTYSVSVTAGTGGAATGYYYVGTVKGYFNTASFTSGTTIGLSATADSYYSFTNWTDSSGTVVSTSNPYELTVTGSETYTANFTIDTFTITVATTTGGSAVGYYYVGTVKGYFNGSHTFNAGTTVGVTTEAYDGYTFTYWTDGNGDPASAENDYEFTVTADETYTAHFSLNTYTIALGAGTGGSVIGYYYIDGLKGYFNSGATMAAGTTVGIVATPDSGYVFSEWLDGNGDHVSYDATYEFTVTASGIYGANFVVAHTLTFVTSAGGTTETVGTVTKNFSDCTYSISGDTVTYTYIEAGAQQTGTFTAPSLAPQYFFVEWVASTLQESGTIAANIVFTAAYGPATIWSNDEYNGSVSIMYHFDDPKTTAYTLSAFADLYQFQGKDAVPQFVQSDEYITWTVYNTTGSAYKTYVKASLMDSDGTVATATYEIGRWSNFILTVDTHTKTITVTKVDSWKSFTQYEEKATETVLGLSASLSDEMVIYDIGAYTTGTAPRQQVTTTTVFLNTYGVVMFDPTFDIDEYWPSQTDIRMSFFSFALYGTSATINGITFPMVSTSKVTIPYITQGYDHIYSDSDDARTKTLTFTNFYLTWESGHCYLTFLDSSGWTVDLGEYTDRTISFSGMWYFQSGVYKSYTATETKIVKDWWHIDFDFQTFALILAGLLVAAGIVLRLQTGAKMTDLLILFGGAAIALILAGGLMIT